jgi:voltage-gated potassium channel
MSSQRRGFGYVLTLTLIVTLAGAAGIDVFENEVNDGMTSLAERCSGQQ